jgi:hypothetical protein
MTTDKATKTPRISAKEQDRNEAIATLRKRIKPGDTVYCILRHVSSSGMSRVIDLCIPDGKAVESIAWLAARAMDDKMVNDRHYGIRVSGCGMDMGFYLVYNLGRTLFPQGFDVVDRTRCNKCQDRPGLDGLGRTCKGCSGTGEVVTPRRGRNGDMSGHDNDGGYALNSKWL